MADLLNLGFNHFSQSFSGFISPHVDDSPGHWRLDVQDVVPFHAHLTFEHFDVSFNNISKGGDIWAQLDKVVRWQTLLSSPSEGPFVHVATVAFSCFS